MKSTVFYSSCLSAKDLKTFQKLGEYLHYLFFPPNERVFIIIMLQADAELNDQREQHNLTITLHNYPKDEVSHHTTT